MKNVKRCLGLLLSAILLFSAATAACAADAPPVPGGSVPIRVEAGTNAQTVLKKLNLPEGTVSSAAGTPLAQNDPVATGMIAASDWQSTPIVVVGDVLGTGVIGLSQLTRLAQAFAGVRPLEGVFLEAGDMNKNGQIDLTDVTMLATLVLTGALPSAQNPPLPESDVMAVVNAARTPLLNPRDQGRVPAAQAAAEGANDFAFRFTEVLLQQKEDPSGNFICSPYSVWLPLAALLNATDETAQPALLEAIGSAGLTPDQVNDAASRMLYGLTAVQQNEWNEEAGEPPVDPLKIANAIFVDRDQTVLPAFADTFASDFLGESIKVDFKSSEAIDAVNQWCSSNTNGLIPKIVEEFDPATVAAIANAIYFSDRWKVEFDPDETKTDVFHAPTGDMQAPFMRRSKQLMRYYEDENVQMVPLDFRTEGGLAILLPKDGDAETLLSSLTQDKFHDMLWEASEMRGDLLLPRFEMENGPMSLNDSLSALGVPLLDAESPAITKLLASPDPLYISQAMQSAVIKVDEKGTTAAAVTVMAMEATGALVEPDDTFVMNCNRPFAFVLYGNTYDGGAQILFTGVVNQPEATA